VHSALRRPPRTRRLCGCATSPMRHGFSPAASSRWRWCSASEPCSIAWWPGRAGEGGLSTDAPSRRRAMSGGRQPPTWASPGGRKRWSVRPTGKGRSTRTGSARSTALHRPNLRTSSLPRGCRDCLPGPDHVDGARPASL
jgi:hypothetical protein